MSVFKVDKITNRDGISGTEIAGITTFTGSSGIVIPRGNDYSKKLPPGYISDNITLYIDVSNGESYTVGSDAIANIVGGEKDAAMHGAPFYETNEGVPALYFNGSDAGIRMDTADAIADLATGDPLTFSVWAKIHPTFSNGGIIMSMQQCNAPSFQIWIGSGSGAYVAEDGRVTWRISGGNEYTVDSGKPDNPVDQVLGGRPRNPKSNDNLYVDRRGSWMNVTGTYSGNTGKLYINGELVSTNSNPDRAGWTTRDVSNTTLAFMNRYPCGTTSWIQGWFHQAAVYKKELSADEVMQNYNVIARRWGI